MPAKTVRKLNVYA